jgi:IS5 family transposase
VIEVRRAQLNFAEGLIAEEVGDLWEDWMRPADQVLDDEQLLSTVYEALAKRCPKSRTRGRLGTPAEVVLRLLLLKHIRNWSYEVVEREVRANLVYRSFTRIGGGKVPDDTVMNKWALTLGPEVIEDLHKRVVTIAQEKKIVDGRKMRVDTTVVESNIHYPTDSSLLGDGVRVLTRAMKRIAAIAGDAGAKLRDRSRSVKYRILEIGRAARSKGGTGKEKLEQGYRKLLEATSRVVGQAKRFSREIASGVKKSSDVFQQAAMEGLRKELDTMAPRVQQVMQQTRARVLGGDTHVNGKLVSIFEPSTEVIRKGKASKPTEFGKMVKIQEAENQMIICYEVFEKRPSDLDTVDSGDRIPRGATGTRSEPGRRGCCLLLGQQRKDGARKGSQTRLYSQSQHQEHGSEEGTKEALVPGGAEMENRLRRANQRNEAPPRAQPLPG